MKPDEIYSNGIIKYLRKCMLAGACGVGLLPCVMASCQIIHIEDAKTQYINAVPLDQITRLQTDINQDKIKLSFDAKFGYLPAVLKALHVSTTSQVVVFSKTSVQKDLISPQTPRSLYFNDTTYIGYVQGAKAMEICTNDPYLGAVYYTLLQREVEKPRFFRTIDACLECHGDKSFARLPQHIMYSSFCARDGSVLAGHNPVETSDSMPLEQRFGGWFVTGDTSNQRTLGNLFAKQQEGAVEFENNPAANTKDMTKVIDASKTLTGYSDIVALMTFGHQQRLQNLIADATYQTNSALALEQVRSHRASTVRSDKGETSQEVIRRVCEPVVDCLLFAGEAKLNGAISGQSGFARYFEGVGPRDRRGRSLRTFDLKRRLFLYPCSYLIYSDSFDALPPTAKQYVYRRLWDVLTGTDKSGKFLHLTRSDCIAIREILGDTRPGFAASRPASIARSATGAER